MFVCVCDEQEIVCEYARVCAYPYDKTNKSMVIKDFGKQKVNTA